MEFNTMELELLVEETNKHVAELQERNLFCFGVFERKPMKWV